MVDVKFISDPTTICEIGIFDKRSRVCRSSRYSISAKYSQVISKRYHSTPTLRHRCSVRILGRQFTPAPCLGVQPVNSVEEGPVIIPSKREEVVVERCAPCSKCSGRWSVPLDLSLLPRLRVWIEDLHDCGQVLPAPLREVICSPTLHYNPAPYSFWAQMCRYLGKGSYLLKDPVYSRSIQGRRKRGSTGARAPLFCCSFCCRATSERFYAHVLRTRTSVHVRPYT